MTRFQKKMRPFALLATGLGVLIAALIIEVAASMLVKAMFMVQW